MESKIKQAMEADLNKIDVLPGGSTDFTRTSTSSSSNSRIMLTKTLGSTLTYSNYADDEGSVESLIDVVQSPPGTFSEKMGSWFQRNKPACPPPVCYILIEQLIVFSVLLIIAIVGFLGFWFYEMN